MAGTDQRSGSNEDGRRLTKAERREEARLKREEIQRKMATRKRNRGWVWCSWWSPSSSRSSRSS